MKWIGSPIQKADPTLTNTVIGALSFDIWWAKWSQEIDFSEEYSEAKGTPRIDPDYLFQHEFTNPDKSAFPYFLSGLIEEYFENRTSFILESNLHNMESYSVLDLAAHHGI